jgi:hypothetical protein
MRPLVDIIDYVGEGKDIDQGVQRLLAAPNAGLRWRWRERLTGKGLLLVIIHQSNSCSFVPPWFTSLVCDIFI